MKNNSFYIGLTLLFLTIISCEKDIVKPTDDINSLVSSVAPFQAPAPDNSSLNNGLGEKVGNERDSTYTLNGVTYKCGVQNYKLSVSRSQIIPSSNSTKSLKSASNTIYPGNIVQGTSVATGNLATASINGDKRSNVKITIVGHLTQGQAYREVPNNFSSIETARQELITLAVPNTTPAKIVWDKQEVITKDQSISSISAKIGGIVPLSIGASLNFSQTNEMHSVIFYFRQDFYDLTVDNSRSSADWFNKDVTVSDIEPAIQSNNPLGYVNSVTYGRMLIAKITSTKSIEEINAAIEVGYKFISVAGSTMQSQTFEQMQFNLYVLGGSPESATNIATSGTGIQMMENIATWIKDGANRPDLALPISYSVNYLSNNEQIKTGIETNFSVSSNPTVVSGATKMTISKITFRQIPNLNGWDTFSSADLYYGITKWNGTSWDNIADNHEFYKTDVTQTQLDNGEISWTTNFDITDFSANYAIDAWDDDGIYSDEWIGDVQFSVNNNIINTGTYPNSVSFFNSVKNVRIELQLSWSK
jgi:hypothetical protein